MSGAHTHTHTRTRLYMRALNQAHTHERAQKQTRKK